MYKSHSYGYDNPNMSYAIARQDEALEDLIKSTRRVIKRHTDYMADTRYPEQPKYYHQRPSFSHKRPSCSHHHTNRVHPPPPPPPPQQYHKSYHPSYNNYPPEPRKQYRHPASPPSPREYYHKSPENSFSRTKKWLNRLRPSNYYHSSQHVHSKFREPQYPYEDHGTDDEVGLFELKEKIRRSSSYNINKIPPTSSDSRPMIIPASVKSSPEKIIVIDVPLDITVILRSVDQKETSVYQVTDLNLVEEILGGSKTNNFPIDQVPETKKTVYKAKAEKSCTVPMAIRTSSTMPNLSREPNTASTVVSSKLATPVKKKSGLIKYFSSLNISKLNDDPFNYLDSDDSTIEDAVDRANNIPIQGSRTSSISEEECEDEEEMLRRAEQRKQTALPRSRSNRQWMV